MNKVTITTQDIVKKDIFYQGNYVVTKKDSAIYLLILVTGRGYSDSTFSGVVIESKDIMDRQKQGYFSNMWFKNQFIQFTGNISIDVE